VGDLKKAGAILLRELAVSFCDIQSMFFWLTIQLDLVTSSRILILVDKQLISRDGMA
jgi:hypothetical protein